MRPRSDTCPACGEPLEPATVLALAHDGVAVTIEDAPYRRCPDGHVTMDLWQGFVEDAVADVRTALVFPSRRWFSRSSSCGACGRFLSMPARATTRSVTVALADAPVFTVRLELPMTRCPACGVDNVVEQGTGRLDDVLRAAFANRGLGPTPR